MDRDEQIENTQRLLNLQAAVRNGKMHFRPQDEEQVREFMAVALRPGELLAPNRLSEKTLGLVRTSAMALRKHTALLSAADATNLDRVVREVMHGVESLVQQHQKTIKDIEAKYSSKNTISVTLGTGAAILGTAAQFIPSLGVLGVAAPVITAGGSVASYVNTKLQEHAEKKLARRSLMGVLATTARN